MTIETVPKKYWFIGGGVLILTFLYFRKKAQNQAAAASNASEGLVSALQLPGGLQYAPITSGISGGAGNNQDSGLPAVSGASGGGGLPATSANSLMLGDITSSAANKPAPVTAATIPGGSSDMLFALMADMLMRTMTPPVQPVPVAAPTPPVTPPAQAAPAPAPASAWSPTNRLGIPSPDQLRAWRDEVAPGTHANNPVYGE
jgi:hypothetical protein